MNTTTNQYTTEHAVAFMNGEGMDDKSRDVADYWFFNANEWEACHDHVQWAFPSNIPSVFNPNAPVVNMQQYVDGLTAQGRMHQRSLITHYLISIGLADGKSTDNVEFVQKNRVFERLHNLLTPNNHNYRRLTRLLNLLYYFDYVWGDEILKQLEKLAEFANVCRPDCVSKQTVLYWRLANAGTLTRYV